MFEKVSRSLKYDSNIFFDHKHIYMDTTTDHFTPLALRVRDKNIAILHKINGKDFFPTRNICTLIALLLNDVSNHLVTS